ncbi:hypothetical protein ACJMK2_025704 [Sinanodonta woodiana]|uniref:Uncharacterized protein n=1 Tax=Sinanodonta woodiana TaxID=1069815 RepID=A0ABD3XL24_SINWO
MYLIHPVFCCLLIFTVTEGKIVPAIVGRNVSFNLTISNLSEDIIIIKHNAIDLILIWPELNNYVKNKKTDRVRVEVYNETESNTIMVTVCIFNVTKHDLGIYSAVTQLRPTEIKASVLLELMGRCRFDLYSNITMIQNIPIFRNHNFDTDLVLACRFPSRSIGKVNGSLKLNNKTVRYWATTSIMNTDTEEIYHYTTAASAPKVEEEAISSANRLIYIIVGLGALLAAVLIAYIQHKIRTCFCVDRESINSANCGTVHGGDMLHGVYESGHYWTIVGNAEGELSTAIETEVELRGEPILLDKKCVSSIVGSIESVRSHKIGFSSLDGYLNPINSNEMGIDGYINPIHTDPVDT